MVCSPPPNVRLLLSAGSLQMDSDDAQKRTAIKCLQLFKDEIKNSKVWHHVCCTVALLHALLGGAHCQQC